MASFRRWKERRWRRDPRCAFCRVVTVLTFPGKCPPPNLATVDHLRDRFDPTRREPIPRNRREVRRVLACRSCNEARGAAREAAQPIDELRRRSNSQSGRWVTILSREGDLDRG